MSAGWIYVLTSDTRPGLVKLGRSFRSGAERAAELRGVYAALGPWREVWAFPVSDAVRVETTAHRMLRSRRVRHAACREVYQADVALVRNVIVSAAYARSRQTAHQRRPLRQSRPHWLRHARTVAMLAALLTLFWVTQG